MTILSYSYGFPPVELHSIIPVQAVLSYKAGESGADRREGGSIQVLVSSPLTIAMQLCAGWVSCRPWLLPAQH